MALRYESPTKAFGAPTPGMLRAASRRADELVARAQRRLQIARFAAAAECSVAEKRQRIIDAMKGGFIPVGLPPCEDTIRGLQDRWLSGEQSLADYVERPRSGRPRKGLPSAVRKFLKEQVIAGTGKSARSLMYEANQIIDSTREEPVTYYQVHQFIARLGRVQRAASRHGSRAAQIDGFPHGTVPTRRSHEVWALDELKFPVWIRRRLGQQWVSARADLVLITDVRSGAVVGYFIVDPTDRSDPETSPDEYGFTTEDVLAGLLSAACPELAPDATRAFAGYLPSRLRWDNAQQHKALTKQLSEAGVEIDTRRIPKRRAISNGAAERPVGILKTWCAGMKGHVDDYTPTDRVDNDAAAYPGEERTNVSGGTGDRPTRRIPILPEQLMSMEELAAEFDAVVHRFNFVHVSRMWGQTHADRYYRYLREILPRRGQDLAWALPSKTTRVCSDGIAHYANCREYRFSVIRGDVMLMLDTLVTYRADPACRGIFLQIGSELHFQPPLENYCEAAGEGTLARNIAAAARLASDQADAARRAALARLVGTDGVVEATEVFDAAVEAFETAKADERAALRAQRDGPAASVSGTPLQADGDALIPFLEDDPAAFAFRTPQASSDEDDAKEAE